VADVSSIIPMAFMINRIFLIAIILALWGYTATATVEEDCIAKGFAEDSLDCSVCAQVLSVIGDEQLHQECLSCCYESSPSAPSGDITFVSARLEVNQYLLGRFPHIEAFVEKHHQQFLPHLSIYYTRNAQPRLVIKRADGSEEALHVGSWKTEHFIEFLKEKMKPQ
jgi:hypothetical protein